MNFLPVLAYLITVPSQVSTDDVIYVRADRLYNDTTVSVDTLSKEDFTTTNSVADALTTTAGVDIVMPGAVGATEILLRGGDANFTAVTLEGIRLNDVTDSRGGAVDVGAIAPFEINQAQIAKGAVSVLEGSDALAGQIALDTGVVSDATRVRGMMRYSERGLVSLNGQVTPWQTDNASLTLTGTSFDYGDAPDGQSFTRSSLSAKLASDQGGQKWSAYIRHGETSREAFPDSSGGDQLAALRQLETSDAEMTMASVRFSAENASGWAPSAGVTYLRRTEQRNTPPVPPALPAGTSDTTFTRATAVGTLSRTVSEDWQILVGSEVTHEVGETVGALDFGFPMSVDFDLDRTTPSIFTEARKSSNADPQDAGVDLYVGVRGDYVDTEQFVPTVRVGTTYRLAGGTTALHASAGTGFKAPSFYAVGDPLVGNPDLDDERSATAEIGITHAVSDQTSVEAAVFYSHYTDLIDFDGATFSLVNRSEVDVTGVETQLRHAAGDHQFSAFAAYTNTDAPAGAVLLRPNWRAGANWRYESGKIVLDADYVYRSETEASSVPTGIVTLNGSHRLDLYAGYQVTDGLAVALTVDDAADSVKEMQPGFSPVGRRVGVRLDVAF